MDDLTKRINKIKHLRQYKDKPDDEIKLLAEEQLNKEKCISDIPFLIEDEEKKIAQNLLDKYLSEYQIESASDRDTLNQLIYLSVLGERIKKFINKESQEKNGAIPLAMLDSLRENNEQIQMFKEKLGMANDNNTDSGLKQWELLKKKTVAYINEHKGCNIVKCPECSKLFMLLMRVDNLTPEKAVWFKGTILFNRPLFDLYYQKKINKDEVAKVLGVSIWYVDYIMENLYLKELEKDKHDTEN